MQQLFIWTASSNCVGYTQFFSIQPYATMSMWMLHIEPWSEQTAHTHTRGPGILKVDDCHCFESWLHLDWLIVHSQSEVALNYATCWQRFLFMSAETRHSRICRRRLSRCDIFLADDVKVKQRPGCEIHRQRGKVSEMCRWVNVGLFAWAAPCGRDEHDWLHNTVTHSQLVGEVCGMQRDIFFFQPQVPRSSLVSCNISHACELSFHFGRKQRACALLAPLFSSVTEAFWKN